MEKNRTLYWKLFLSTFSLSAFTFGGGYVIVPLLKKRFVDKLKWIEEEEMLNLVAISQSSPGPIAVNASILVGYRIAGIFGAVVSAFGTVLPPLIIQGILSGIRPAVVALIASAGLSILIIAIWGEGGITTKPTDINLSAVGIFLVSLFVLKKWKPDPLFVMFGSGIAGLILYLWIGVS